MAADITEFAAVLDGLLRQTYSFYYRAHAFHWNVVGPDFAEYHELFGGIAADVYGATDDLAESIRRLGGFAPQQIGPIGQDGPTIVDPMEMCEVLLAENEVFLANLGGALRMANDVNEQGILNLLAERQFAHEKFRWFLRSTLS